MTPIRSPRISPTHRHGLEGQRSRGRERNRRLADHRRHPEVGVRLRIDAEVQQKVTVRRPTAAGRRARTVPPLPRRSYASDTGRANESGRSVAGVAMSRRVSGGAGGGASPDAALREWRARWPIQLRRRTRPSKRAVRSAPMLGPRSSRMRRPPTRGGLHRCRADAAWDLCPDNAATATRTDADVDAGNADQSGSLLITETIVSVMSSPANARRPVNISYSTAPNAQMSARLSTVFPRACSGDM